MTSSQRRWSFVAALAVVALVGVPGAAAGAAEADGKPIFDRLCSACHSIGGGDKAGPDLAGLADRREVDWVTKFILAPDEVLASGDPIAKELLDKYRVQMPNLGVTEEQIGPLLAYLGFAAQTPTTTEPATTEPATTEPTPTVPAAGAGDPGRGKSLFEGFERFDAGGPSCLSCHSVAGVGALGGGQLGPDLTGAYEKYGGEQGLGAALANVAFPTMVPIFSRKQLIDTEVADLVAFLQDAPQQERSGGAARDLLLLSLAVVFVVGAAGMAIWGRRLHGVRKPLVNSSRGK